MVGLVGGKGFNPELVCSLPGLHIRPLLERPTTFQSYSAYSKISCFQGWPVLLFASQLF